MADITLVWDNVNMIGDWSILAGDLVTGQDLATAYGISFFTDREAGDDDVIPDASGDPRGWWGDDDLGSKFWMRERSAATADLPAIIEQDAQQAAQWLLDTGAVASHTFAAEWIAPGFLGLTVTAAMSDGRQSVVQYKWAWQGLV